MKVLGERTIYEWKFLDFKEVDIIKPNWQPWVWEKVSRKWPGAVGALVEHTENNTYILVEQFRPVVNKRVIELVAWVIDKKDKTNEEIIAEEIKEETWYIAKYIEFVMSWPKSPWLTDEMGYDYYAQVSWIRWIQQLWDSEDIEVLEIDKNSIDRFLEYKEKKWVMVSSSIYSILYKILTVKKNKLK